MGNQHSAADGSATTRPSRPFSRSGGALGLSKSELDRRCLSSGLYDSCQWEEKAIRRLIGDGRIAARLRGGEDRNSESERECPICFLQYSQINVTKCCHANICTECYLQVRPQREKYSTCPFCNNGRLQVTVAKQMGQEQIKEREKEEQRVIEARIRERSIQPGVEVGGTKTGPSVVNRGESEGDSDPSPFGSTLKRNSMVALMRARSESFASEENNTSSDNIAIEALAMTPEERRCLENEMRAQHSHPLALRVQAEAAERQLQNERAYSRSQGESLPGSWSQRSGEVFRSSSVVTGDISSRRRGAGPRDWNLIVDAFERGGNGEVQSIDDLVVLEAAILLSMEEEARRPRTTGAGSEDNFDAARHARDGFPLVRSFLASRRSDGSSGDLSESASNDHNQSLARTLSNSRRPRRNQLLRTGQRALSGESSENSALDGISEEEQMALAIAASLQDQTQNTSDSGDTGERALEPTASVLDTGLEGDGRGSVGVILDEDSGGGPLQPTRPEHEVDILEHVHAPDHVNPDEPRSFWTGDVAVGVIQDSVDIDEMTDDQANVIGSPHHDTLSGGERSVSVEAGLASFPNPGTREITSGSFGSQDPEETEALSYV